MENEVEQQTAGAPLVEPAAAPAPEQPAERVYFLDVNESRPSRTLLGLTFLAAQVRGEISGRRSIRSREIPGDIHAWLTLQVIPDYRINGPEIAASRVRGTIANSSGHPKPTCACESCTTWRRGRLELAAYFGLIDG